MIFGCHLDSEPQCGYKYSYLFLKLKFQWHDDYVNKRLDIRGYWRRIMAHEELSIFLGILGLILLIGFYFGPRKESRLVKRREGMIMLVPSAALLFVLALVIFSGVIG